jgi:hypothetical protein
LRSVVAGNLVPWPLVTCGVAWISVGAVKRPAHRLILLGLLLWSPFAIVVAHRGLALRDMLPMIYLVYLAAAILLADVSAWLLRETPRATACATVAVIVGALVLSGFVGERSFFNESHRPREASDWNNPLVQRAATWLEGNAAPGDSIMSSRLYFSQLYTLTDARFPVAQLPTVNVVPRPGAATYLTPRSTLFRWEDADLPAPRPDEPWLTVDEFARKRYFTALSESDLLDGLHKRRVDFLVVSGEDAAFSSTRYLDYFYDNPGFALVYQERSATSSITIFRVDRQRLARRDYATVVPATVLNRLFAQYRGDMSPQQFVRAISPRGITVRPSEGLSPELTAVTTNGD